MRQLKSITEYLAGRIQGCHSSGCVASKDYPGNPKFKHDKFWSVATDQTGDKTEDAYKMKWHQIGHGKIQLRLSVGIFSDAFLCEAYVKKDEKHEKRKLAIVKTRLELIRRNKCIPKREVIMKTQTLTSHKMWNLLKQDIKCIRKVCLRNLYRSLFKQHSRLKGLMIS